MKKLKHRALRQYAQGEEVAGGWLRGGAEIKSRRSDSRAHPLSHSPLRCLPWPPPLAHCSQPLTTDGNIPVCWDLTLVNDRLENQFQSHSLGVRTFRKPMQITFIDPNPDIPLPHVCSSQPHPGMRKHVCRALAFHMVPRRNAQVLKNVPFTSALAHALCDTIQCLSPRNHSLFPKRKIPTQFFRSNSNATSSRKVP